MKKNIQLAIIIFCVFLLGVIGGTVISASQPPELTSILLDPANKTILQNKGYINSLTLDSILCDAGRNICSANFVNEITKERFSQPLKYNYNSTDLNTASKKALIEYVKTIQKADSNSITKIPAGVQLNIQ